MDTAVIPQAPLPLVPAGLGGRLGSLPPKTRLMAGLGVAALLAVLVALGMSSSRGDYRVLFANLGEKDGGAIIEKLAQMNVPYRIGDGGIISVPASQVHELRMKLTTAGLPRGSVVGNELLDTRPFGQTQGQERSTQQRALEGELTRTIQSLDSVHTARVHLALPNQNGFFREQQKPSASVVVTLHPGRVLERAQVAGIVHLVSSSVPELAARAVSIIDSSGGLLWPQGENAQGLDTQQLQYLREVEAAHTKRVVDLLEPIVGRDNLRATVTAEIDFSQSEQTSESFKPNQGDAATAAVRAQRTQESTAPGSATPAGIPGAVSNQPGADATAPINGAAQAMQGAGGGSAAGNARRESETRYELDKTVRVTRGATGAVSRLNAAVLVNHRSVTDAKGKTTSTPLSADEIANLTALVQQSIGFNAERGDSVRVVNAPFRSEPVPSAEEAPPWQQPWLHDLLRAGAAPAALALIGLVVVFSLLRPALKAALKPPEPAATGGRIDEVVGGDAPLPGAEALALEAPRIKDKLQAARKLAKDNPVAVANIVRGWVNGEVA